MKAVDEGQCGLPREELAGSAPKLLDVPGEIESSEEGLAKIIQIVTERIPQRFGLDAVRDVQVLSPMNRGAIGARSLNVEL